jgi:hypothetical protein
MSSTIGRIKAELAPVTAQLLWACAMDDDDLADYLLQTAILAAAIRLDDDLGQQLGSARRARIRKLLREGRMLALQGEEEAVSRFSTYLEEESADDIPF